MSVIASVHPVLPDRQYPQSEITDLFAQILDDAGAVALLRRVHASAGVRTRHLVLPLDDYPDLGGFGSANDAFLHHGVDLGAAAVTGALRDAGLEPQDVDLIVSTTVTGVAAPSIEARIAGAVGLRPDVKRLPLFGLGCVAGAAGVARVHDYLRGDPNGVAVLLSVELCSLTFQRSDSRPANLVASGLFGDGATAVVMVGADRARTMAGPASGPGPAVVDSRSHLFPDTQRTMGWDVSANGLTIVLSADVPAVARQYLGDDVRSFLADHDLTVDDVSTWVCHPGGPKVIEAVTDTLGLTPADLDLTWRSLAGVGNLSSSSVLHVLADTIAKQPEPGTPGIMMAMGPGFCSELVLLQW